MARARRLLLCRLYSAWAVVRVFATPPRELSRRLRCVLEWIDAISPWILWTFVIAWGAIWGSFANVVIARVPWGKSVVYPASHCPQCETPIRWYDNLPILSWLRLKGRCASCRAVIPRRYLLVEVAGLVASALAFLHAAGGLSLWRWSSSPLDVLVVWMALTYLLIALVALTAIDLEHALLPHKITGFLAILGVIYAAIGPRGGDFRGFVPGQDLYGALLGFAIAYGSMWAFAWVYRLITGRYGIGGGDFMLFGVLGAWFGWEALPILLLAASIQGVLAAALASRFFPSLMQEVSSDAFWEEDHPAASVEESAEADRADAADEEGSAPGHLGIAFGPFLCLAAVEYLFFGGYYMRWFWGL